MSKKWFLNPILTICVKRLTKRLRRIHNARQFWFESTLVFKAQWFRLGGRVVHHLTRRYVLTQKHIV
ncbi:hypothetical protein CGG86_23035 [Vibrio parahaemolyticus]|nr:hypothetical protein CGI96_24155 [Vibrio parahaemolyticus]TOQ86764.1 hypothetical protein CGG86_23035 [Vibrio parahaemolyticus]TOR24453.1 hypothetical protein CGG77_24860 [Vibrio parahaemolyticus]